jgi:prepilin-type N-terminal cleavage/methylation domain-containing protein
MRRTNFTPSGGNRGAQRPRAFTLIEILIVVIILGILAAITIPQFAGATTTSRKVSLRGELRTIRGAIQLYRVEHRDQLPDLVGTNWDAIVQYSDINGTIAAAPDLAVNPPIDRGPYLKEIPFNPLADSRVIDSAAGAGVGWVYDQSTGTIVATEDGIGTLFDEHAPD